MSSPIDVVGHAALDYLFEVEHIASPNESYPITSYEVLFGGGAANIAAAMAQLGGKSRLVAAVGDDFSTSGYEKHLNSLGVDLSLLYHIEGEESTKAFVYTDPNHNQSSYFYWGSSSKLPDMEAPALDFVHLAPSEASFSARVAQKSKFVSFDPGQDLVTYSKEHLVTILDNTDLLFANIHEVKRVKEMTGKSLNDLKKSISTVVVTCDSSGSKIYSKNEKIDIPIVAVKAVDPTGAGDGYRAGFLLAFREGFPVEVCGKIGATVASFEVECVGCQTNLPSWNDMKKRYEENFGVLPL
ncbi:carbohydrate kinase family protein [Methanohalophilus mahii]|uniref:Cytidine kinase inosine-guanosine kinase n=1 Tax=Methanohalophilus mahii (strain ATCC 35705 / DSM 5219 / SLP) TaxID=547558 RepID=D5EAH3_METMS|nr:carbohydrate kinase family protein [Methanohalophilus mahii]ADE36174.1 cytidine kinase; inosine-guanosine kinase [Methanohalophilus mahii DSM 5219]